MKHTYLIFGIIGVLLIGGIWYVVSKKDPAVLPLPQTSEFDVVTLGRGYYLEKRSNDPNGFGDHIHYDFRLVYQNSRGHITELVSSVKDAIPELKEQFNRTIVFLSFPEGSEKIFFQGILMNTDAGGGSLYAFNIESKKFEKLKSPLHPYVRSLSPLGDGIATISPSTDPESVRSIVVVDLEKDTTKTVVTLEAPNETLNQCANDSCFSGIVVEMKWQGNNTIVYDVFDVTRSLPPEPGTGFDSHPLIEERSVVIGS